MTEIRTELPQEMDAVTRERLVQLACVAAWSDLTVAPEERAVVLQLAAAVALDPRSMAKVQTWLDGPPPFIDPQAIPPEHRAAFLEALRAVIAADGRLARSECETLRLIEELVA